MEEMLAHPGAWSVPPALSGVPVQWARVETVRLIAAGEAAGEARAASAAFARAAEESAGFTERLRSAFAAHGEAVQGLRDALPAGLVRAARGEPTTTIAAELADVVSALSVGTSGLEQALSRNAAAVREAAIHGARAAEKAEAAFGSFRSVRLDALLADLPRLVRRGARDSGRDVDLVQESTNLEVDAARAESVRAIVKGCVRALLGPSRARGRKSRRAEAIPASRLSVFARAAGEHLYLRIALSSGAPDPDRLKAVLEALQRRIEREGGSLEAESRKGGSASILATIRSAAALTTRTVEFLLARAGDAWYALPASAVVECIEAGMAMTEYVLDGSRLPTLRMNDTRDPREGVVVRTPRGGAVLLFDAIGGREYALQTIGGGESIAGISGSVRRPDGSAALLVDLGVLLPAPENVKGRLPASHAGSGARVKH
jgi:chemotaxis protein histidine kinase CheA